MYNITGSDAVMLIPTRKLLIITITAPAVARFPDATLGTLKTPLPDSGTDATTLKLFFSN